MKTEKEFEALMPAFYEAVKGKNGSEYLNASITFTLKNSFGTIIMCLLHESDVEPPAVFLTDHPLNDVGFIILEDFGGRWGYHVGSKTEFKAEPNKFRRLISQKENLSSGG